MSRNAPEAIFKLFKAASKNVDSHTLYEKASDLLHVIRQTNQNDTARLKNLNDQFMLQTMKLIAVGDFTNFRQLLRNHP